MLDFRVVIAACVAGVVILFGGIGLIASFKTAHEPVARVGNRIVERPRIEPNASRPLVIETPATVRAPAKSSPAREVARPLEPAPAPAPVPTPASAPIPAAAPAPAPEVPPVEARAPEPAQPAAPEITGTIPPRVAPVNPAPVNQPPAIGNLPTTVPVEHPASRADLPRSTTPAAKKTPRRPRPAPRPAEPQNPFATIFGGLNQ